MLHGFEVTDPIRNFADYGFTMCSTVTGINQSLYEAIGLRHQYWDICNHTVSAVEYDGKFHMIDSSMSNLVTNDDGVTLATVQEAAADSARLVGSAACTRPARTGSSPAPMRSATCRTSSTRPTGAVTARVCRRFLFAPSLKYRDYYYNWNSGHRYVLNLREDETYTRYYRPLGTTADYWVRAKRSPLPDPATDVRDRFHESVRHAWQRQLDVHAEVSTPDAWARAAYRSSNIVADARAASGRMSPGRPSEVVYKVQAANVIASQHIAGAVRAAPIPLATATLAVSVNHGRPGRTSATIGTTIGSAVPAHRRSCAPR